MRLSPIALALSAHIVSADLMAADIPTEQDTQQADVVVSATRGKRELQRAPNTVTSKTGEVASRTGATTLKSLVDDEADLSVRESVVRFTAAGTATGRAGSEGLNIRGLEGNQVLMLQDGIRLPAAFSFGAFATGRGDYLELEGMKDAEILRGPASAQFGSDGLAGGISLRTLEPVDILKGRDLGGFVRGRYNSLDRAWTETGAVAASEGAWQGLVLGSVRQGHETQNHGSNDSLNVDRTTPNPQDVRNRYLLGKVSYALDPSETIGASLEVLRRTNDTEVYSARSKSPLVSTSTLDLDAHDTIKRDRVSLDYLLNDLNGEWVQRAEVKVYWQRAQVAQHAVEDRNTAADRIRHNTYDTDSTGISLLFGSSFAGVFSQRLTYGVDWHRDQISTLRDGTVPSPGDTFPSKPFPDTRYDLTGAFLQDEIDLASVSVIPGLRFDHFSLKPDGAGFTGKTVSLSDHAISPRLGGVWRVTEYFAPYAQWAKGFRAPSPDQVNNGFTNLTSGYMSIGNNALKAESADSFEVGIRGRVDTVRYALTTYDNRYKDFISQQMIRGTGTPADPMVFQYINLSDAHIRGFEARLDWSFASTWLASASFAQASGDSETAGKRTPLDSINPRKWVVTLRHDAASLSGFARLIHANAKDSDRIAPAAVKPFSAPAWTVLDLGATWKAGKAMDLNLTLNNVFDRHYWRWSDVRGLAESSAVKDAYTAPGRTMQISARYSF
ncbi:TonB-dependent hemoglobin/transferrin/lactoferrin family receptor [Burkholderiaceae bacterium DAT-1]|nr:TonB-dependent hemoglobin/transferrin/lactoferrin family receptor [Burkholderiaceae bacterium DAT-1]